jgi:hypothetical protein
VVRAFGDRDMKTLGDGGYVEIVDHRKGRSLYGSDPSLSQVCLRVGIRSSATFRRIAEPKPADLISIDIDTVTYAVTNYDLVIDLYAEPDRHLTSEPGRRRKFVRRIVALVVG